MKSNRRRFLKSGAMLGAVGALLGAGAGAPTEAMAVEPPPPVDTSTYINGVTFMGPLTVSGSRGVVIQNCLFDGGSSMSAFITVRHPTEYLQITDNLLHINANQPMASTGGMSMGGTIAGVMVTSDARRDRSAAL